MRKFFIPLFILISAFVFTQEPKLFFMVNIDEEKPFLEDLLLKELHELLEEEAVFLPSNLTESDYEFVVRGIDVYYNREHVGYTVAGTVILHDPDLVRLTDTIVIAIGFGPAAIRAAALTLHTYLMYIYGLAQDRMSSRETPARGNWQNN